MDNDILWLLSLEFLSAQEVGRVASVNQDFQSYAFDKFIWKWLFAKDWLGNRSRTRRGDTVEPEFVSSVGADFKRRPQGLSAIGWEIKVFDEEIEEWRDGVVVDAFFQEDRGLLWLQVIRKAASFSVACGLNQISIILRVASFPHTTTLSDPSNTQG